MSSLWGQSVRFNTFYINLEQISQIFILVPYYWMELISERMFSQIVWQRWNGKVIYHSASVKFLS